MPFVIKERTTPTLTFALRNSLNAPIALVDLQTLTLTFKDDDSNVINSRNAQDVKNANNVTVDASCNVRWAMQQADTVMSEARTQARRRALFDFTFTESGATKRWYEVLDFIVVNEPWIV